VFVDGESLADMLIEAGMAVRYDGGKKTHKWCLGGNKWERKKEAAARTTGTTRKRSSGTG
jgi:endonuclease YncB( thermonuclease family)